MAYPAYDPRDDISDTLMKQRGASAFDYGLANAGTAMQPMASVTPSTLAAGAAMPGLPTTPAGGVPGSGLATAAASNVQLPPQRQGMMGAMPTMGGLGAPVMGGMPGMGQQRRQMARRY